MHPEGRAVDTDRMGPGDQRCALALPRLGEEGAGEGHPDKCWGTSGWKVSTAFFCIFHGSYESSLWQKRKKQYVKIKEKQALCWEAGRGEEAAPSAPDVTDLPRRGPSWADLLINPCRCAHRGGEVTAPKRTCRRPRAGDGRLHSPQRRASQEAPPPRSPADGEGAARTPRLRQLSKGTLTPNC